MAQSVLSTIPFYAMQSMRIPKGVCDIIDKKIRQFIWGSKEGEKRIHLVNWDKVTRAKTKGGLGIRKANDMNLAFLAKAGWRLEKEEDKLWVKVIQRKYFKAQNETRGGKDSKEISNFWKAIMAARHILDKGMRKQVRNGENVYFWKDKWIEGVPLDGESLGDHMEKE